MQVNSAGSTENIMTHGWVLAFGNPAQNPAGWAMSRPKPGPARPSNKPSFKKYSDYNGVKRHFKTSYLMDYKCNFCDLSVLHEMHLQWHAQDCPLP